MSVKPAVAAVIATIAVYAIAHWGLCDDALASDWILFVTAIVVVWYTIETVEMRKQGERREQLEAKPFVGFELKLRDASSVWLEVRNYSRNPATLRVLVRLQTSAGPGRFGAGEYSGQQDWLLAGFQSFRGWIPMLTLLATTQGESFKVAIQQAAGAAPRVTWPANPEMRLDAQVAIYDTERRLVRVQRQEYVIPWPNQETAISVWPEVAPKTFVGSTWPTLLPEGKLELS